MKKTTKVLLSLAGIFLSVGIITMVVTSIFAIREGVMPFEYGILNHVIDDIESEEFEMNSKSQTVELSNIKGISLSGNYGKVEFVKGDRFAYEIFGNDIDSSLFTHSVENDVWNISIKNRSGFYFFGIGSDDHISKLRITVPSTEVLDNIYINLSAGSVKIERLAAKNLSISMGAGSLDADELVGEDEVSLSVSAGRCKVVNLIGGNPKFRCEAGQIDARGILTGIGKMDCGVGQINVQVIGESKEYDYNAKCGVGAITIDGSAIGGLGTKNSKQTNAANFFDLNCGIGQINVGFVAMNN